DWYAYDADRYGNTSPEYFQDRQTPNDVFERQKAGHYRENNEQMFRLGIAMKDVRAIVCQRASWRLGAETTLRDAGVTDIDTLLVGTAEEVKQRCAEHGLRFVGGVSVEEYIRTEVPRQLKHMANIIREVVEWNDVVWWPKVQAIAPDYKSKNEFIRISDFATLRRSLEQAGVTPSDVNPEWSGSWDEVVKSQVSKIGRGICDELQRSEIETVGGKSIDMLRDMDLRALAEALEAQGIEKLWGTDIHEIIGDGGTDPRQQTLTALREAGITNINGKPIEEFVIEAKTYGDFIDITRGAPLRSSQKKEVPVAQGEQNLPPPPPANPLV
ncbi:hypothetical protein HY629_02975, partial [Candidatus Uhrbacteria bacterium]|nr:hypothetical protein [Candidatus Uhrbacteria bacterium]